MLAVMDWVASAVELDSVVVLEVVVIAFCCRGGNSASTNETSTFRAFFKGFVGGSSVWPLVVTAAYDARWQRLAVYACDAAV